MDDQKVRGLVGDDGRIAHTVLTDEGDLPETPPAL